MCQQLCVTEIGLFVSSTLTSSSWLIQMYVCIEVNDRHEQKRKKNSWCRGRSFLLVQNLQSKSLMLLISYNIHAN